MMAGDEYYDDDVTSGPIDHDAERNSMWCDQCGVHHSGDCPDEDDNDDDDDLEPCPRCGGDGDIPSGRTAYTCPACQGEGVRS